MEHLSGSEFDRHDKKVIKIMKNIEKSYQYSEENIKRFAKFQRFVFKSSLNKDEEDILNSMNRPTLQFNILEAFISRQRGEFAKQEPSIVISSCNENKPVDPTIIDFLEGHLKYILFEANNNEFEYRVQTDSLVGGFSVAKLWTDYTNEMSFEQDINVGRVYDPCLCGFDPLAQHPHKGDGNFCFELYPMTKEDFEEKFPDIDISHLTFSDNLGSFNWTYKGREDDIILVANYFEKKKTPTKLVYLSNNKVLTEKEYKEYLEQWKAAGHIEQPAIVINERVSPLITIVRYQLINRKIIKEDKTDYSILPLVYNGGNNMIIRNVESTLVEEISRPYVYHAQDAQRLKNLAGQALANGIESMVMHKFKVAKESIPDEEDYREAYTDVQTPANLIYNAYMPYNPAGATPPVPIPPPHLPSFIVPVSFRLFGRWIDHV